MSVFISVCLTRHPLDYRFKGTTAMPPSVVEDVLHTSGPSGPMSGILNSSTANGQWTPQTVLATLPAPPQTNSTSPLPFFHMIERLKTNKREGWRRFGLDRGESISDHMYRMSIITLLCPPSLASRIDIARCTKMALIHDMAESLVGDITPMDGVAKSEKHRREEETMDYLCTQLLGNVDGGENGKHIREIWQEYEDSKTLESHFVHDVDKMELLLQMMEYERTHEGRKELGEFSHVARRIVLPEVQAWAAELLAERDQFWTSLGKVPNGMLDMSDENKRRQDEYYGGNANGSAVVNGSGKA